MILPLERLREIAERRSPSLRWGEAEKIAAELLANREAQPEASVIPDIGSNVVNDAAWKLHDTLTEHGPLNGRQFNNLKGCLYEALKIVMNAPPAPAVPDERHAFESFVAQRFGETIDRRRAKNGDNEYLAWDMAMAWIVWQRRAPMLTQPVSQGYKLVPVEPTPKQWAAGLKAMDTGMDKVTLVYKAMLATAPTQGEKQ
ncbi:TPA: hypothetical protein ACKP7A_001920 [Serratia liquefaciens]